MDLLKRALDGAVRRINLLLIKNVRYLPQFPRN
ncbi:MAG: hypothetical protein RL271_570 [Actinomycetota bacterium]|jgi:hypothetical protein